MTGEELTVLGLIQKEVGGLGAKVDTLGTKVDGVTSLIHEKTEALSTKFAADHALAHAQGSCQDIRDLKASQANTDTRLRHLELTWAKAIGLLLGAGAAGGIASKAWSALFS